ncbi:MAG TPA: redoxin domain-containing protein [Kofleriaceae bacterium]|nr:redoxin domain-containing protein [Kofleriaceae bacterium]
MRLALALAIAACTHAAPPPAAPPHPAPPPPAEPERGPPWVGIRFDPTSSRIVQVLHGTPGERAGLRIGDQVIELDRAPIAKASEFIARIATRRAGDTVAIAVMRGGQRVELRATLAVRPAVASLSRTLVDHPAPAFALPALDGSTVELGALAGHVVVVEFFATWCGPCLLTAPELNAWHAKYRDRGVRVIGISDETAPELADYVKDHQLAYTIARDDGDRIAGSYLLEALPMIVVIDRTGVIRYIGIGAGDFAAIEALVERLL